MKSETEIARENVDSKDRLTKNERGVWRLVCRKHKQTCQRILEFLEDIIFKVKNRPKELQLSEDKIVMDRLKNEITDLKQAIKTYEEAGI